MVHSYQRFALLGLLLWALGCASARMSDRQIDSLFRSGRYDEAAARLKQGMEKHGEGTDELLFLLDLGLVLHTSGHYKESNQYLLKADKVAEIKDYTSLAEEAGTLLTSDNIKQYKGEEFENVLISVYLALNYSLLGDKENALVEARRVNKKLYRMVHEGKRDYPQSAFARYVSGILYESDGEYEDAYLDYKETLKLWPNYTRIGRDLWRVSSVLHRTDEMNDWEKKFSLSQEEKDAAKALIQKKSKFGEVIVYFENGISPIKRPNPDFSSLPKFYPRHNPVQYAKVFVNGKYELDTLPLEDIEATAILNLDQKYGAMVAKKLAGIVVKEVVGNQVAKQTDSPLLGLATKLAFYISDQADVRSWSLLPKELHVARVALQPGTYQVKVQPVGDSGVVPEQTVVVRAGKKSFVGFRYIPQ